MEDKNIKENQIQAISPPLLNSAGAKQGGEAKNSESSTELSELRKRIDRSEKETRAMSEAMKTTLIDVRSMLQEFDNPFNLLKEMGVDKLVNKAVAEVENGVNKAKRDEAMKRMGNPNEALDEKETPRKIEIHETTYKPKEKNLESRIDVMEDVLKELTETLDTALDDYKNQSETITRPATIPIAHNEYADYDYTDGNYIVYTQLVSEYLANRFGRRGAERLLLNEVTRNQASPRVVKDILDSLSIHALKDVEESVEPRTLSLSANNADLDDKIMITLLLKNLDKPLSEWGSTAILYLLTVLVKRTAEGKLTRD